MAEPHVHRFSAVRTGSNRAGEAVFVMRCTCGEPLKDDGLPNDVRVMVENIRNGNADPYLEAILAATHDRKRAIRGTPGFPRERQ